MDEIRAICKEKFTMLEKRLNSKSKTVDEHGIAIEGLKHDIKHLTNSLNGLTKALWGTSATIIATLFSFFVWFVQGLK